jgi:ParB-like chromosome segregation protein Spo0J
MTEETKAPKAYEFHPYADLFPPLDKDSIGFKALTEDIRAHRQYEPVILFEGKILDGRNRYRACQHLGRDVVTRDYVGTDPIGFVLSVNLHRRHLNTSQRAMVAAKLTSLEKGANQHSEGTSIEVASKLLNVGRASIERARQVLAHGDPSLIEEVEQGKTSVTDAAKKPEEPEDPKEPQAPKKPDPAKVFSIINKFMAALKELKDHDADTAMVAATIVVQQLQDGGFLKKKAA